MTRIHSEKELLELFRPIDQGEVQLPHEMEFPLMVKDYLTWVEPSGFRVYLVFEDREHNRAFGVTFQRNKKTGDGVPRMCEWCHCVRQGDGVGLLTVHASDNRRIGLHLCRDLSCREKVILRPGANDVPETLPKQEKVARIVGRINDFARRNLF